MDLLQEYDYLLARFNKAFECTWQEGDKVDIEFKRIVKRLSEIESIIKEG